MVAQLASEQEKQLLPVTIHASTPAHCFQNDGVKKGWEGMGIRGAHQSSSSSSSVLKEARWHKQCAERVCCIVVVVVVVVVFGWWRSCWCQDGTFLQSVL